MFTYAIMLLTVGENDSTVVRHVSTGATRVIEVEVEVFTLVIASLAFRVNVYKPARLVSLAEI